MRDMSNPFSTIYFMHGSVRMAVSKRRNHVSNQLKVGERYLDPYYEN